MTKIALRTLAFAGALTAMTGIAFAGDCPADKVKVGATPPGTAPASGVTDDVLTAIDIVKINPAFKDHMFRMRRLVVQPGGVVPWHSHGERPANIYIVSGSITEYRSSCAVPIEHKAGEAVAEAGKEIAHWWRNNTDQPTVLISADILHVEAKDKHQM